MESFVPPPPLLPDIVPQTMEQQQQPHHHHKQQAQLSPPQTHLTSLDDVCMSPIETKPTSQPAPPPPPPPPTQNQQQTSAHHYGSAIVLPPHHYAIASSMGPQGVPINQPPPLPSPRQQPPPPLPPIPQQHLQQQQQQQQIQLQHHQQQQLPEFDITPEKVVENILGIMSNENENKNENDKVVLTNSVCLLFRLSIDHVRGFGICQAISASQEIMSRLYDIIANDSDDLIICYATGNITSISKYEEGRAAVLNYSPMYPVYIPSEGVQCLFRSLQSRDSNAVIFAITAIHNLLLDGRFEIQNMAKEQIKHGIEYIVKLLDNKCLQHNYEFKVIVLDCLQILAYGNTENRIAIRDSDGPYLILRTIDENLISENLVDGNLTMQQPRDELIETASRVLKSLSACSKNKRDIIEKNGYNGINILTNCIRRKNHEILKTCLWTLRNLSDLINVTRGEHDIYINELVFRLLQILEEYADEPCIITCALGILANLTCNNETVKQLICNYNGYNKYNGINILLNTINMAISDAPDFNIIDKEILEPAVCALCHLIKSHNPQLAYMVAVSINGPLHVFKILRDRSLSISAELYKAINKLIVSIEPAINDMSR